MSEFTLLILSPGANTVVHRLASLWFQVLTSFCRVLRIFCSLRFARRWKCQCVLSYQIPKGGILCLMKIDRHILLLLLKVPGSLRSWEQMAWFANLLHSSG